MTAQIRIPDDALRAFCRRWGVKEFALFGSVLGERFGPDSDVDVLVELRPDADLDLYDWIAMRDELAGLFERPVHLTSRKGLRNPIRRQAILDSCETIYAA